MPTVIDALVGLAMTYVASAPERALPLVLVALNHPSIPPRAKSRAERLCAELETQLSPTQVEDAHAATFEKVITEIVNDNNSVWKNVL